MKVWITKYVLTEGLLEVDADTFPDMPSMVRYVEKGSSVYVGKGHWHTERSVAVKKANSIVAKKIATLQTQIGKLRQLSFQ